MSNTTNILELPSEIREKMNVKEMVNKNETNTEPHQSQNMSPGVSLDESTINQIVNGLQRASIAGVTQLQSRDIPMTTSGISNDVEIQPNYVPIHKNDYIQQHKENIYYTNPQYNSTDDIYNEFQIPLLLSILYFLFQLPFLRKCLFTYIPFLFSKDGNMNLNGLLFNSILFGTVFYLLHKSTELFSKM